MIKLKHLIKEETIHSCDCGGDCCSVNESKGMELGKIFTGHGFAFKKENFEVKESDLGLTYKRGKTVKVTHKKSGKELIIIDKPNVKREYEKIGYFAEIKESSVILEFEKYHLGGVLDSKLKKRLERAIKLWGGKVDAVGMDTIKFRLSSSEVTKLPLLLKKLDQNKNVWIGDKRKKNIWDRKRKIDKLESCGYTMSAEPPHKKLKSSGGTGSEDRELKVNEGKWSKIMKSVRKGSKAGPWSIVVYKNKKVIHQRPVKILQQIPAHYEDVKKKFPKASIGIEDKYGERVYTESVKENLIYVDKDMKDGKFDPKNPQVHIQGYGVVNLKTLQDSLSRKFTELAKRAKKGDFENIEHLIKKNSVIQGFVGAGVDTNKQLKTSQMKRKITMYKQKRYK